MTRAFRWLAGSMGAITAAAICLTILAAPVVYGVLTFGIWQSYDQCGTAIPPWSEAPESSRVERRLFPAQLTCTFSDGSVLRVGLSGDEWTRPGPGTR